LLLLYLIYVCEMCMSWYSFVMCAYKTGISRKKRDVVILSFYSRNRNIICVRCSVYYHIIIILNLQPIAVRVLYMVFVIKYLRICFFTLFLYFCESSELADERRLASPHPPPINYYYIWFRSFRANRLIKAGQVGGFYKLVKLKMNDG